MSGRIKVSVLCVALFLTACGTPQGEAGEEPTGPGSSTTTTALGSPTTVSTPDTTTTTVPDTTTTTAAGGDQDVAPLLASLHADTPITSGRIEGSMEMTGLDEATVGVSEGVILFSTSFDTASGDSSFLMDMSSMVGSIETDDSDPFSGLAAGMLGEMEVRQIGGRVFLRFPFFTSMLGSETDWVSMPADEGQELASGFETMPTDPNEILGDFGDVGATVEDLGVEPVNGVEATHYRISLDAEEMDLTPSEQADLEASGLFLDGVIPLDIWISEDGYMVRMVMVIDGSGVEAPPEESFDTMTLRYDFFDINGEVVIEEPPASEVTAVEDLEGFDLGLGQ
jgi:hypothetical protein